MQIINWAVKKPVSVLMMICFILLMGSVSIFRLSIDLLPKMNIPVAVVNTQYPGAGPLEVENLVTRPLEAALAMVHNVKRINSTSSEGNSTIIIEFNQDIDMNFATLEMREKIDLVKNYMPEGVIPPIILKIDPNALPIMHIGISGDVDFTELQGIIENKIAPRIERLPGVASVTLSGGVKEEILIQADPTKLQALGTNLQQIMGIIMAENINLPTGEVIDGKQQRLVRVLGEFQSLDEIKELPIPLSSGAVVALKELVEIEQVLGEPQEITKMNGEASLRLTIQKQSIANTVKVANLIHQELNELKEQYQNLTMNPIVDQSVYIKKSIGNVGKTAIYGGLLAVFVLYLFLRNYRSTLIIALAIPISIFTTFTFMYFSNMTLNLLSLGGFALGVGMLVDNGIVVTENIHRYREEGNSATEAAIKGTREVAMAVAASTLTTVAVFLPIVFVQGMTAQIFRELALTVTYSLLASLLVSLTLVPMLSAKLLEKKLPTTDQKESVFFRAFDRGMSKLHDAYKIVLIKSLKHRGWVLGLSTILLIVSVGILLWLGAEYFPEFDEGSFTIDIKLPHGASLSQTEDIVAEVEQLVWGQKEVKALFTTIGGGDNFFFQSNRRDNRAAIDGELIPQGQRKKTTAEVIDEIRSKLTTIPGAEISIGSNSSVMSMGFGGASVEVELRGDDINTLKNISQDVIEIIKGIEGTREVESNYAEGQPQLAIRLNRDVTAAYGLQAAQIAATVRNLLQGTTVTRFRLDGKEIDVIIKGESYLRENIGNFLQAPISTPLGIAVPLEQMITLENVKSPSAIRHSDQVRAITVSAAIYNRDLKTIIGEIQEKLDQYSLPAGYNYVFRGQQEQLEEAFDSLILVVILAILLVYMILASQFQSMLHPFTIMFSVPLAFSGGALGLLITGRPLSVPALIGAVVLAGIVVNNGIVLIDYILLLREQGTNRGDAIINAGYTRLRPILMTTFTTVLGLLPLALGLGEGSEAQAPMATVVIGGLLSATFLTLVVIPVVYSVFDDIKVRGISQ